LYEILVESARTTAMLFNSWISATIFAYFVNFTTLPGDLKQWITAWGLSIIMVVSAMMVIFVILDTLVVLAFPTLSLWLPSLKDQGS
jgi:C4-dicarboxylate transporter DctM subunit